MRSERFVCPSSGIVLGALMRRSRRSILVALTLAATGHLALAWLRGVQAEQQTAKPLTTQFVKRAPRLTKPLELKKRPQPKRRAVQREMVAVKARVGLGKQAALFAPNQVLASLARPDTDVGRVAASGGVGIEPQALADAVESSRDVEQKIDMSLELLDIQALDTGRYHALVVQDPQDKRNIEGFCHLAIAVLPGAYSPNGYTFEWYALPGFQRLVHTMDALTNIKTDALGRITLGDSELFKAPWLFLTALLPFKLTARDIENFGRYLTAGGFAFADGSDASVYCSGFTALRGLLVGALATQGTEVVFQKLPHSHPIYHCYYDFDGPPIGADNAGHSRWPEQCKIVEYIEGIEVDGRLLAILSGKEYTHPWTFWGPGNYVNYGDWLNWNPERPLQFGINTIIFALTQEGSITKRLMDGVE